MGLTNSGNRFAIWTRRALIGPDGGLQTGGGVTTEVLVVEDDVGVVTLVDVLDEEVVVGLVVLVVDDVGVVELVDEATAVTPQVTWPMKTSPTAVGPRSRSCRAVTVIEPSGLTVCSLKMNWKVSPTVSRLPLTV
jgi:hypothetical protein